MTALKQHNNAVSIPVLYLLVSILSFLCLHNAYGASPKVRLSGRIPALTYQSVDMGVVPDSTIIRIIIALPLQNRNAAITTLSQISNPASPRFGQYLKHNEIRDKFSPTASDYQAVIDYLKSQGFSIVKTYDNRSIIAADAVAGTIESAFDIRIHSYQTGSGRIFYASDRTPSIPTEIAGKITGIFGLDNAVQFKPHYKIANPSLSVLLNPSITTSSVGTGPGGYLSPSNIKSVYNLSSVSENGSGQSIGLIEYDGYTDSYVNTYTDYFGLPRANLVKVNLDGASGSPTTTGGQQEVLLDIELVSALAPNATAIKVYIAPNSTAYTLDMMNAIYTDNTTVKSVSSSWGIGETDESTSYYAAEHDVLLQMALAGQSVYVASGDFGAYDNRSTLSVGDPASQPYITGVGGTTLSANSGSYLSETTWWDGTYGGGGGISTLWSLPYYQQGFGASTTNRNVPDVSLDSDPGSGYVVVVPSSGTSGTGAFYAFGGTSAAAPLWAAFTALINQRRAANGLSSIGFVNPILYALASTSQYGSNFHDINNNSTNGYFQALTGYDNATGLGSFNGAVMMSTLASASSTAPSAPVLTGTAGDTLSALSWTQPTGAWVYYIKRRLSTSASYTIISANNISSSYNDTGLTNGTPYYYVVTAVGAGGESVNSNEVSVSPALAAPTPPSIASTSPTSVQALTTFTLTVNGSNFQSGAQISWNGTALTTTYVSSTQLTAVVPLANNGTQSSYPQQYPVIVTNPDSTTSNTVYVAITNPLPVITSVSPSSVTGATTFTLTVNGSGFVSGAAIKWNGTNMTTTYVSSTQLTASINKYYDTLSSYPGSASVVVLNPDGNRSSAASVTITAPPAVPTITSLSPSSVTGAKTFTLTVNGTNFVSGSVIKWNGTNITTTCVSATQLTASISKFYTTLTSYPGSATISVLNPDSTRSTGATLTITAPLPAISSLSPTSVVGATTFTLTVNGSNFVSGAVIKWNGTNMTTTYVSSTQLTATINKYYDTLSSYPGTATVTIMNPDGGRSSGATITITPPITPPSITSLSPSSVTGATNFTLTVNGTNFESGAVIKWNGTNMTTTYVSSTQLTASIGKYYDTLSTYPGSATVSVLNPDGGRSTGATLTITSP